MIWLALSLATINVLLIIAAARHQQQYQDLEDAHVASLRELEAALSENAALTRLVAKNTITMHDQRVTLAIYGTALAHALRGREDEAYALIGELGNPIREPREDD